MLPNLSDMELPALIIELKSQMITIRNATVVVECIIARLDAINVSAPLLTRKTDVELALEIAKKQRIPIPLPAALQSSPAFPSVSNAVFTQQSHCALPQIRSAGISSAEFGNCGSFEFAAVKPKKRIFVSRLPVDITG